jgi:hypothetical protein
VLQYYTLRGEKLRFACHSERSEASLFPAAPAQRFFTALCSVQNDTPSLVGVPKRDSYPWAVYNAGKDACSTLHQYQQRDRLLRQRSAAGAACAGCATVAVGVYQNLSPSQKTN